MKTRLTLQIDEELVRRTKRYAKEQGKSVSQLVADYFAALDKPIEEQRKEDLPPLTRSLVGSLEGHEVSEKDYHEYQKRKYEMVLEEITRRVGPEKAPMLHNEILLNRRELP
jgi:hypothetical protein